jgi:hypothetical protein
MSAHLRRCSPPTARRAGASISVTTSITPSYAEPDLFACTLDIFEDDLRRLLIAGHRAKL